MYIIRRLIVLCLAIICVGLCANADNDKSYKRVGNTYSSTGGFKSASRSPIPTGATWKDSKGNQYPIYMSESGSCYIIRISNKTGKEYKYYLGPKISQDICKQLGKEYKGKK